MRTAYDAIVVGARCAGSPTAMLLARRGHRVLLVDRAAFPSDTISTHLIQPLGVAALARWGLLERLVATGCPPIHSYSFDFGAFTLRGSPGTDAWPVAYCARRTVLDKLLVDAAAASGAEVREHFTVEEVVSERGRVVGVRGRSGAGPRVFERAEVVVGADGRHSFVARAVGAERYHERPPISAAFYTYWADFPVAEFEIHIRPRRGFAAAPTHDGLTATIGGWPADEFEDRQAYERHFFEMVELVPEFAARMRRARRVSRFHGATLPNFFRKPYGPGWALVGDAGYLKDSITAQGIGDAFRDAEAVADALHDVWAGARSFGEAMGAYQRTRDREALPMYELTCQLAALEPPPPTMQRMLAAMQGDRKAMDGFVQMNAGTIPPTAFVPPPGMAAGPSIGAAAT